MRLAQIEARIKEIKTELETRGGELSVEENEKLVKEAEELNEERKGLLDAAEKRNATLANIATGEAQGAKVVRTFAKEEAAGTDDVYASNEYRKAFMEYVTRGAAMPAEYRQDANTKTTDVGVIIPTTVADMIARKLETAGNIMALVTKTAYKGGVAIPKETLKPVATWVAEGAKSDRQKVTDGSVTFAYHKLRCAVSVSLEVDTMSIAAFEARLAESITEAMLKAIDAAIIAGTGSGQPQGIINSTETAETVEVGALTYDVLCKAEGAVPEAYENAAKWCMCKKTFMGVLGMTDKDGQPIARVNYGIAGKPERYILGREVVLTEHLPDFAKAELQAKFAFIFDFAGYDLNTNYAIGIKKYEDNETDDMVTKGVMLADGKVIDGNGLVILKKVAAG